MKYLFTILFATSLCFTSFAQEEIDYKIKGFRTFVWGTELTEMMLDDEQANFIKIEKEKDGEYFVLPNESLIIGNLLLTSIEYVFSKKDDRFYKVVLSGKKEDADQMNFIVDFKYGDNVNEDIKDDKIVKQWVIQNVTITMKEYTFNKFELVIESDWEAAEAYRKNTSVADF